MFNVVESEALWLYTMRYVFTVYDNKCFVFPLIVNVQ